MARDSLLEKTYRGGSDAWDVGPAGALATAEFFGALAAPATGRLKMWDGTNWTAYPLKVWDGSAFVEKPLKHWNGSAWVPSNA